MTTVLDALADRLQAAASHNHATEQPPSIILWTDGDARWRAALPELRKRLPQLWTLGPYDPASEQGPAPWVKWRLGQVAEGDPTPVLYLPGVRRLQFRSLEDFDATLRPIAELQFRGTWWTQQNGKDWTPFAFLSSTKGGLGLSVAEDQATISALERLVSRVLAASLHELKKPSRLESSHFVDLLTSDLEGDLLDWLDDPSGVRAGCTDDEWAVFRDFVRQRLDVDLDRDGPIVVAERLVQRSGGWMKVWNRFEAAVPASYANVVKQIEKTEPPPLSVGPSADLRGNERQEQALRAAIVEVADLSESAARDRVRGLEKEHGPRRDWVWAKLGRAKLAGVLKPLADLAEVTEAPIAGTRLEALASWYAKTGHQADRHALAAMAMADHADGAAIRAAVRVLYLPWLQRAADALRALVETDGYPVSTTTAVEDGTCLLFADGLRWDVGAQLSERLAGHAVRVEETGRWVAFPPVTGTSKPDVSPIRHQLTGGRAADFTPCVAATGKPLDGNAFRKLMEAEGVQLLDDNDTGDPSGRGWTEFGDIDKYGHKHGWKTARHVDEQVHHLEQRILELLDAGWSTVRVTTDHGWLLVPGGLPSVKLPGWLTEARWQRCAVAKTTSQVDFPSLPWAWDGAVQVAFPPAVDAFSIKTNNSREYAHGGLTLQECFTPVLTVKAHAPSASGTLGEMKWLGLRLRATVKGATAGLSIDLRQKVGDASTSILPAPRPVSEDGKASALVGDDRHEGLSVFAVLLAPDGTVLHKRPTTVGGDA